MLKELQQVSAEVDAVMEEIELSSTDPSEYFDEASMLMGDINTNVAELQATLEFAETVNMLDEFSEKNGTSSTVREFVKSKLNVPELAACKPAMEGFLADAGKKIVGFMQEILRKIKDFVIKFLKGIKGSTKVLEKKQKKLPKPEKFNIEKFQSFDNYRNLEPGKVSSVYGSLTVFADVIQELEDATKNERSLSNLMDAKYSMNMQHVKDINVTLSELDLGKFEVKSPFNRIKFTPNEKFKLGKKNDNNKFMTTDQVYGNVELGIQGAKQSLATLDVSTKFNAKLSKQIYQEYMVEGKEAVAFVIYALKEITNILSRISKTLLASTNRLLDYALKAGETDAKQKDSSYVVGLNPHQKALPGS